MGKTEKIHEMFDEIAPEYDHLNHLMSLDFDKTWRRRALKHIVPSTGRNTDRTKAFSAAPASSPDSNQSPAAASGSSPNRSNSPVSSTPPAAASGNVNDGNAESYHVLDIACGTGDFSIAIARRMVSKGLAQAPSQDGLPATNLSAGSRLSSSETPAQSASCRATPESARNTSDEAQPGQLAPVTGLDLSEGMLEVMRKKVQQKGLDGIISCEQGNSESMRFADASFDCVTIAFGIRNFEHREAALREILRVLKPGGRLVILELSTPTIPVIRGLFKFYFTRVSPLLGAKVAGNKAAYSYLPASVLAFPGKKEWMQTMRDCGYSRVMHRAFTFGICRMYIGFKDFR